MSALTCASADYQVIGKVVGVQNNTFTIKQFDIAAVRDTEGNFYDLPVKYNKVTSYHNGLCKRTVKADTSGGNLLGMAINIATQKAFYLIEKNGRFVDVDIDELVFKCRER
jgi:hypothetical protein